MVSNRKTVDSDVFYRSLFEYNPDIVFYMDTNGIIVKANDGFAATLGYVNEEITSSPFEHFLYSSEIGTYKNLFAKVLTGEVQDVHTILSHKNGHPLEIQFRTIPAKMDDHMYGVFGLAKDISEIEKTKQALLESEVILKTIIDNDMIGIYLLNGVELLDANTRFYEMLGVEHSTNGVDFWDYVHPEDRDDIQSIYEHLKDGEKSFDHSFRFMRKDGTQIDVEAYSKKIWYQNHFTVVGAIQDVTESKKTAALNEYLAYHDSLTDLPNRRLFLEKLEQELLISKTLMLDWQ